MVGLLNSWIHFRLDDESFPLLFHPQTGYITYSRGGLVAHNFSNLLGSRSFIFWCTERGLSCCNPMVHCCFLEFGVFPLPTSSSWLKNKKDIFVQESEIILYFPCAQILIFFPSFFLGYSRVGAKGFATLPALSKSIYTMTLIVSSSMVFMSS